MMRVIGETSAYGFAARVNEQPAAPELLLPERVIHRHRRTRHDILVIHIRRDADDPPRRRADVDELHHRIGPHHVAVDRILIREHALRQALADDDHRLAASPIGVVEIASGDHRHAQRREEAGRHRPEPRRADPLRPARARGRPPRTRSPGRSCPRRATARACRPRRVHARQLADAPDRLLVETDDLLGRPPVRHDRNIQRQHVCACRSRSAPPAARAASSAACSRPPAARTTRQSGSRRKPAAGGWCRR